MATLVKVESFDENRFLYTSSLQKVESLDENRFLYTSSLQKVETLDHNVFVYLSSLSKVETIDENPDLEFPIFIAVDTGLRVALRKDRVVVSV